MKCRNQRGIVPFFSKEGVDTKKFLVRKWKKLLHLNKLCLCEINKK